EAYLVDDNYQLVVQFVVVVVEVLPSSMEVVTTSNIRARNRDKYHLLESLLRPSDETGSTTGLCSYYFDFEDHAHLLSVFPRSLRYPCLV
nr:hypothetical protein [Tanacetum cinerariifolium]